MQGVDRRHGVQNGAMGPHIAPQVERCQKFVALHPGRYFQVVDMVRAQLSPEPLELGQRCQTLRRAAGEEGRVDGARRGAHQNLERKPCPRHCVGHLAQLCGDAQQHAHLVGRASAAAHQDQAASRPGARLGLCVNQRGKCHKGSPKERGGSFNGGGLRSL
jgi:hypothetical protein